MWRRALPHRHHLPTPISLRSPRADLPRIRATRNQTTARDRARARGIGTAARWAEIAGWDVDGQTRPGTAPSGSAVDGPAVVGPPTTGPPRNGASAEFRSCFSGIRTKEDRHLRPGLDGGGGPCRAVPCGRAHETRRAARISSGRHSPLRPHHCGGRGDHPLPPPRKVHRVHHTRGSRCGDQHPAVLVPKRLADHPGRHGDCQPPPSQAPDQVPLQHRAVHRVDGCRADPLSAQGLIALAMGVTAFGVTNLVAMSGLVSILEDRKFAPVLRSSVQMSALTVYGNAAVGIVSAVLWQTRPEFLALLVVPAATLHLAYRGVVRSAELLEEVVTERDRLNRIVGGASDGIVLLDRDGGVVVWSPAMVRFTGIEENDARGRLISEVLVADDPSGQPVDSLEPLRLASPDAPVTSVEMVLRHREGGERVAQARHTMLFDQHGSCTGDAILIHDITHEYEAERLKDDFLARVSHELRTPLTPIKGYAQTLLRKKGNVSPERMEDALGRIVERVDHMTLLIDDVLLVARMVAGSANVEGTMRMDSVDLVDLVETTLPPFKSMEPERSFEVIAEPDLPLVVADRTRVAQIAANLVSNACKYSAKDAPVTVQLHNEGQWIALGVADRGRGIPTDQVDKVFERFHRLENPLTMETGGIGLGLYITRGFAEAMGGTLTVTSKVGEGSTFTLRLPNPEWKPAH